MVLRHRTLLRHFSWQLMYKDVVVSGLLRRRHSSYHRHVEPPLVIVRFRLLLCHRWLFPSISVVAYPLATRLCELHIGLDCQPISSATTPVCAYHCSLSGVPASTLRPHHWCLYSPSLAAFTTTGRLQSCGHGVSSTEWSVSAITWIS